MTIARPLEARYAALGVFGVGLLLEIKSGPFAGRKIPLTTGQSILIGRLPERAQFALAHDTNVSGVHFAVECGASGCRVVDKKSTNGTFLNGARIQEGMLATGDEITAGQTVFVVCIVPDEQLSATLPGVPPAPRSSGQPIASVAPAAASRQRVPSPAPPLSLPEPEVFRPTAPERSQRDSKGSVPFARPDAGLPHPHACAPVAPVVAKPQPVATPPAARSSTAPALGIGKWAFARIPEGWQIQEGLGIQMMTKDDKVFPSNIGVMEEPAGPGVTLSKYVEAQTKMFCEYLREPRIDAALPPKISGAAESIALEVRYSTKDGHAIYYHRLYARSGSAIGVITLTTLEKDLASVRPAYDDFLAGASFTA